MKKMSYYTLSLLTCLLMTGFQAGIASNKCSKTCLALKSNIDKNKISKQSTEKSSENVADFIITNRVILF
jgi:hypothetical protein